MSRLLFVEGESDEKFIKSFIQYLQLTNIEIEILGSDTGLKKALKELETKIPKDNIEKVGIILDADSIGVKKRLQYIDKTVSEVFNGKNNIPTNFPYLSYIMNIDDKGELEDVLKKIHLQEATTANCIIKCITEHTNKTWETDNKELNKDWAYSYAKYDCKDEQDKWDFDSDILKDLKDFLIDLQR